MCGPVVCGYQYYNMQTDSSSSKALVTTNKTKKSVIPQMMSLNSVKRTSHFTRRNTSTKYRTFRELQAVKLPGFQSTVCSDCGLLGCENTWCWR